MNVAGTSAMSPNVSPPKVQNTALSVVCREALGEAAVVLQLGIGDRFEVLGVIGGVQLRLVQRRLVA